MKRDEYTPSELIILCVLMVLLIVALIAWGSGAIHVDKKSLMRQSPIGQTSEVTPPAVDKLALEYGFPSQFSNMAVVKPVSASKAFAQSNSCVISFDVSQSSFAWNGALYKAHLTQAEVCDKVGNVVVQPYFNTADKGTFSISRVSYVPGDTVFVRYRAVCNPLGGRGCAFSAWSDYEPVFVQ